jgi:hypothetical protein
MLKAVCVLLDPSPDFRCTFFPNGWWLKACLAHDYNCADAQAQKSMKMRIEADKQLKHDVSISGTTKLQKRLSQPISSIMYVGISLYSIVLCKWYRGYK